VVRLRDRFGDYGLVGAMIISRRPGLLDVDNVLLSCRALGRRVEHRMLWHLGRMAQEEGREKVRINFIPTARNQPAREFLECLGVRIETGEGRACRLEFDSGCLAELTSSVCDKHAGRVGNVSDATQESLYQA